MKSLKKGNIQPNFVCKECSSIPLLGINFSFQKRESSGTLSDTIELFSYCIYEHKNKSKIKNKKIRKTPFDKLNFSEITEKNIEIICESCKKLEIKYHCFDCKRNICQNCFEYHKNHKYYCNKKYISKKELKQIKDDFNKSQINLDKNLKAILKQINEFELQLNDHYIKIIRKLMKN